LVQNLEIIKLAWFSISSWPIPVMITRWHFIWMEKWVNPSSWQDNKHVL